MASNEIGTPVELYIYDLSQGLVSLMSPVFIERQINGIWHTSIVAYGMEYFFGSGGIQTCTPGSTILREPNQTKILGETYVPYIVFRDYIQALGESTYAGSQYNLIQHNCNNFSEEVSQFLCGVSIPKYILDLPEVFLSSSLGQALRPLLDQLELSAENLPIHQPQRSLPLPKATRREPSPDFLELNSRIEEIRVNSLKLEEKRNSLNEKLARKERKKEKKRRKLLREGRSLPPELESPPAIPITTISFTSTTEKRTMAEAEAVNGTVIQNATAPVEDIVEQERKLDEERKKNREPPIVFKDVVDVPTEYEALSAALANVLHEPDKVAMNELKQYMINNEGSWALGEDFIFFICRVLHENNISPESRKHLLRILAAAALKDDIILLLHQDRKDHLIMNYAFNMETATLMEQQSLALFFANLFENLSSSEWLLYISEWNYKNQQLSNIRITTKVAVNALLHPDSELQNYGTAIIYNIACKEVFDDVALELTMALLQYLQSMPNEEHLYRCLKALAQFISIAEQDVSQMIQMVGPHPNMFQGTSPRIDELIAQISSKI